MIAKLSRYCGKILAVVFTSIVAPVLVDLAVHDFHGEQAKTPANEQILSQHWEDPQPREQFLSFLPPSSQPQQAVLSESRYTPAPISAILHVIAQGTGRTPEDALRNALRAALRQALSSQVDVDTPVKSQVKILDAILCDNGEVIQSWKECGASKEWRLKGTLYHRGVAVEVNVYALRNRLRVLHVATGNRRADCGQKNCSCIRTAF